MVPWEGPLGECKPKPQGDKVHVNLCGAMTGEKLFSMEARLPFQLTNEWGEVLNTPLRKMKDADTGFLLIDTKLTKQDPRIEDDGELHLRVLWTQPVFKNDIDEAQERNGSRRERKEFRQCVANSIWHLPEG